ncbi:hypothetical protein [Dokdonella fugitiva]|uniref:Dolichyl-phosphate-mannose-protein mannosyltransferase n=1 Tax=Dokdonella fugitiva TaxID=328517 RepID=A0A4R2I9R1_9GAMM|nr:hypothetical protein [Dokdonella fugitiva]MBA8884805.1 hypothetical protein [Dokdonella fugitiva]TCO40822.1 hypothetical protein EV148_104184 [Dokdonella fugitiva]
MAAARRGHPAAAWPWWLLAGLALAAGVWLRASQLRTQMLFDDEWHAVRMLIRSDMAGIAGHFGFADYCIPLTLYYRWLYEHAMLDEWAMHLPLLLAGCALLPVAPWLLRASLAPATRATWVALLAVSPPLVYFSRTARPYALLALCGVVAIAAFRNWYERRGSPRTWACLYVVATFVAGWAHLLSLVFTLWPFAWHGLGALRGCLDRATRPAAARRLASLAGLGVATVLPLALVLAPPLLGDWASMAAKAGTNTVSVESVFRTFLMQFGLADARAAAPVAALFAFGAWRLWRRERALVALVLSGCVVGAIVVCAARPAWIQHAPVLVRYAAPVLPFLLLFLAEGIAGLAGKLRVPAFAALAAGIAVAILAWRGPLPQWYYTPNQFMGHALFQFDYAADANPYVTELELGPVSAFYRDLARRPAGSVTLIEAPGLLESNYVPDPWLQQIHRQNVKHALAAPVCGSGEGWDEYPYTATGDRFTRVARLAELLDGATWGGDYLVLRLTPWTLPPGARFPWPVAWPDMPACIAKVEGILGAPVFRDETIVVFDLHGTRRR